MLIRRLLWAVTFLIAGAQASYASPIAYEFTGTATFQNGDFVGQGSAVTGTIEFDDGLTDASALTTTALYSKVLAANAPLAATYQYSITVGAVTKTGSGDVSATAFLNVFDDAPNEVFNFTVGEFTLQGLSIGAGGVIALPANGGFSPASDIATVLDGLDPTAFNNNSNSTWAESGTTLNQVDFVWETISRVPEPSTAALLGLSLLGGAIASRRR